MAQANPVTGTFSGTGTSDSLVPKLGGKRGKRVFFNLSLAFAGTATVKLQRSFDNGTTWLQVGSDYTASAQEQHYEMEQDVEYRLECTAHTNNVVYRLSV